MSEWLGWTSLKTWVDGVLPAGSLRARFAKGAFWSIAGVAIAQGLALAASVLVVRILNSREIYGQLGILRSTVQMFGTFAGLSLGMTNIKHVAEYRRADPARAGRIIGMSALVSFVSGGGMALVLLLLAPWFAASTMNAPHLVNELRVGCLILLFETVNGVQTGTLAGLEAFRAIARLSLLRGILTFPLMVGGAWVGSAYGRPVMGLVAALGLSAAAGCALYNIALRRMLRQEGIRVSYHDIRPELPILWRFSLPAMLSAAATGPVLWAGNAILVNVHPHGHAELGVFNAANQWQFPVTFFAFQFSAILLPMLSSFNVDRGGRAKGGIVMEATYAVLVVITLPAVAAVSCFSNQVMGLYGARFAGTGAVLAAVLFVGGCKALGSIPGTAIASRGAMWSGLFINSVWSALFLLFVWLWSPQGAWGIANAFAAAYAIGAVYGLLYCVARRFCSWSLTLRIWGATALVALASYGIERIGPLSWRIVAAAGACVAALLVSWQAWRTYRRIALAAAAAAPPDAACPVCGSRTRLDGVVLGGYRIEACDECSHRLARAQRLPDAAYEILYADGAYRQTILDETLQHLDDDLAGHATYRPFFRTASPLEHPRLLDVGCGSGRFCRSAEKHGWQVSGFDVSQTAIATASRLSQGRFHVMSLDDAVERLGTFDVVTAFEFLEHQADPKDAIRKIIRLVRPGGLVFVTVPHWRSPEVKDGRRAEGLPPLHLQFFTFMSLRWLLEDAGLEDVGVGGIRMSSHKPGLLGLYHVLRRWLRAPLGLYAAGRRP